MRSFRAWCLVVRPGAFLQIKLWTPWASTKDPQGHWWGTHTGRPSLRVTATRTASSSRRNPHEAIDWECEQPIPAMWELCSLKGSLLYGSLQACLHQGAILQDSWTVPEWLFSGKNVRNCTWGCRPRQEIYLKVGVVRRQAARKDVVLEWARYYYYYYYYYLKFNRYTKLKACHKILMR